MARAYVLVKTEVAKVEEIQTALKGIPGVRDVDIVTGDFDLIVVLELPSPHEIGRVVMREIHGLPGILTTTTHIVVG